MVDLFGIGELVKFVKYGIVSMIVLMIVNVVLISYVVKKVRELRV